MTKTKIYLPSERRFSLRWWLAGVRNAIFISTITVLIWVYADMEFTDDKDFTATVFLNPDKTTNLAPPPGGVTIFMDTGKAADQVLLPAPPGKVEVTFKVRGTRSTLGAFQRQLEAERRQIPYDVSGVSVPGKNELSTADLLSRAVGPWLSKQGLTILSTTPAQVSFELSVSQVAQVEFDATGATFTEPPKIDPSEVNLRLTSDDLKALRKDLPANAPIIVKTRKLDLRTAPTPYTADVELVPPATQYPVKMDVKTVRVTAQIDQRTDVKDLRVAVEMRMPPTWIEDGTWNEYKLLKKDELEWQPLIKVQGARKDLERLRPEDVEANITLTDGDKSPVASWLARAVNVHFPKGMDVELVGEPPTVHFKLEKVQRAAPAATTPPVSEAP